MSIAPYLLAVLGLAALMVVHEGGHYFAARKFGMRVTRFSIGFGPTIVKHRPKGSDTVFQIAIIPFLAYVQIAGMNPFEENDPKDKSSYANASLLARVVTIAAGPAANYVFASVLMFIGFMLGGQTISDDASMKVNPSPDGPAAHAGIVAGDKILSINNTPIHNWDELKNAVGAHPGEEIDIEVEREGKGAMHLKATPGVDGEKRGKIMVGPPYRVAKVTVGEAALLSVTEPPKVVYALVTGLAKMLTLKQRPELSGPVGIVKETAGAVRTGAGDAFKLLGAISAYLGGFNLLPFPALDGGRLIFLGYEAASRRKADAKVEAKVHAIGLLMFLTLLAFVTYGEVFAKH